MVTRLEQAKIICINRNCPIRMKCLRYTRARKCVENIGNFKPRPDDSCNHFVSNDGIDSKNPRAT